MASRRSICITGAPGSGKTSVGKAIAALLDMSHVSTGDVVRQMAQEQTETGHQIASALEAGHVAPPFLVDRHLAGLLERGSLVLDGYPRYQQQLDHLLKRVRPVPVIFMLHLTPEESMERLIGRRRADYAYERELARLDEYARLTYPLASKIMLCCGENINAAQPLQATLEQVEAHYRRKTL